MATDPSAPPLPTLLEWQAIRYGDSVETRLALEFFRERGWPVDDPCDSAMFDRISAFQAGYRAHHQSGALRVREDPTLEYAREELLRLKPHVEKWKTADGREVRSRMANDLLALIDARIEALRVREEERTLEATWQRIQQIHDDAVMVCRSGCSSFGDGNTPLDPEHCWACGVSYRMRRVAEELYRPIAEFRHRVREEEGHGEQQKDLGAHVRHGGRNDLGPAAPPELPHDDPAARAMALYVGQGEVGCDAKYEFDAQRYGCTRDRGHDGEHVACGGPRSHDEFYYLHWPQAGILSSLRTHRGRIVTQE